MPIIIFAISVVFIFSIKLKFTRGSCGGQDIKRANEDHCLFHENAIRAQNEAMRTHNAAGAEAMRTYDMAHTNAVSAHTDFTNNIFM